MARRYPEHEADKDEVKNSCSKELLEFETSAILFNEDEIKILTSTNRVELIASFKRCVQKVYEFNSVRKRKLLELTIGSTELVDDKKLKVKTSCPKFLVTGNTSVEDMGYSSEITAISEDFEENEKDVIVYCGDHSTFLQTYSNLLAIILHICLMLFNNLELTSFDVLYIVIAYFKVILLGIIAMIEMHGNEEVLKCIRDTNTKALIIYPVFLSLLLTATEIQSIRKFATKFLRYIPLANWFINIETKTVNQNMKQVTQSHFAIGVLAISLFGAAIGNIILVFIIKKVICEYVVGERY